MGVAGNPGLKGDQGLPGRPGLTGPKGRDGFDGPKGTPGFPGPPGLNGLPGECSGGELQTRGEPGPIGRPGDAGLPGQAGAKGEPGFPGLPGRNGEKGDNGLPGLTGPMGAPGTRGNQGTDGYPGPMGSAGAPGEQGPPGNAFVRAGLMITRHSQDQSIPECPTNTVKLWEGYSLLYFSGNEKSHQQDLGSAGSCLKRFSVMPFIRCDISNVCNFAQNNDLSYWLSTTQPIPKMPMEGGSIRQYISRCSVCEAPANVIALHSQSETIPTCPNGWNRLWEGYSFVMVIHIIYKQVFSIFQLKFFFIFF
jgi:collagen type IV alpha